MILEKMLCYDCRNKIKEIFQICRKTYVQYKIKIIRFKPGVFSAMEYVLFGNLYPIYIVISIRNLLLH